MPNIKSAQKRMRQNEVRRLRNRQNRSRMRSRMKKFEQLLKDNKVDEARQMLEGVYSIIDRTARKGIIHANTAARYKSRLTKQLNQMAS